MTPTPTRRPITGIVLAGGRAARFGADKLAEPVDGIAVLDRAIGAVAALATELIVVGPSRPRPTTAGVAIRAIDDPEPFGGPLQALAGALASASNDVAVVVAGDMPSLVALVLALLVETLATDAADADAVVLADPRVPPRLQPVPMAIRVAPAREAARASLAAGDRSLVRLLGRLTVRELPVREWLPLDPDARTLVDIDLPDDLSTCARRRPRSTNALKPLPVPIAAGYALARSNGEAPSAHAGRNVMPMVQEFWKKLNANEKMVMYGAGLVLIAFLVGLVVSYGFGTSTGDIVAAIAVAVVYWLKYSPNKINWPAPVETIVLVIAGIAALFALLGALTALSFLFAFGASAIAFIINFVGCAMMAWFAYKEYQKLPKAAAPTPPAPPAA